MKIAQLIQSSQESVGSVCGGSRGWRRRFALWEIARCRQWKLHKWCVHVPRHLRVWLPWGAGQGNQERERSGNTWRWSDGGLMSTTLAQHQATIGWPSSACRTRTSHSSKYNTRHTKQADSQQNGQKSTSFWPNVADVRPATDRRLSNASRELPVASSYRDWRCGGGGGGSILRLCGGSVHAGAAYLLARRGGGGGEEHLPSRNLLKVSDYSLESKSSSGCQGDDLVYTRAYQHHPPSLSGRRCTSAWSPERWST